MKILAIALLAIVSVIGANTIGHAQSQTIITASSSAGKVSNGAIFQVTIYVEAAQEVTLAQALVKFDTTALELSGEPTYEESPFSQGSPDNVRGTDFFQLSRFSTGPIFPVGNAKLATLSFKAIKSEGKTKIEVDPAGSAIFSKEAEPQNVMSAVSGVEVELAPYADNPLAGTQLLVETGDGRSELKTTPPLTDGNNGVALPLRTQTDEERNRLAETISSNNKAAEEFTTEPTVTPWYEQPRHFVPVIIILLGVGTIYLWVKRQTIANKKLPQNQTNPLAGSAEGVNETRVIEPSNKNP